MSCHETNEVLNCENTKLELIRSHEVHWKGALLWLSIVVLCNERAPETTTMAHSQCVHVWLAPVYVSFISTARSYYNYHT